MLNNKIICGLKILRNGENFVVKILAAKLEWLIKFERLNKIDWLNVSHYILVANFGYIKQALIIVNDKNCPKKICNESLVVTKNLFRNLKTCLVFIQATLNQMDCHCHNLH